MRFKKSLVFEDPEILEKIHINYRLNYLKDTVLATALDELNLQSISDMINCNNTDLINSILLNEDNISQIFEKLKTDSFDDEKYEAIKFLQELFIMSRNLQAQGRLNLMKSIKSMSDYNIISLIRESLQLSASMSK